VDDSTVLPTDVSEEAARRRGASRVPQMCPECVRVFSVQTTTKCLFAGTLRKPSDGLEPSTPSLPSRFCGNWSQPVATVLACFRRFRGLPICHRLPLVAPARLHKRSILSVQIRDEKTDCEHSGPPTEPRDHFPCREVVIGSTRGVVLILRFDGRSRRSRRNSRARCSRSTNALRMMGTKRPPPLY
jgi:hypothetical protein